jgi:hypothetical protein
MKKKYFELSDKITRLANRGARKAIEQAHRAGLAVPFSIGGKIVYQLPDGSITDKCPEYPNNAALSNTDKVSADNY